MKPLSLIFTLLLVTGCVGEAAVQKEEAAPKRMEQKHAAHGAEFTQHYKDSKFKISERGLYSVELVVKGDRLQVGGNEMDIVIHDRKDRDVVGAALTLDPWMPDMGHGVPEMPKITERGGGLYTATMVRASMPGKWEIRISIKADAGDDRVVFEFPDVQPKESSMKDAGEMGHYSMGGDMKGMDQTKDMDLSTTRSSMNGLFTVSYKSESADINVGRIHSWILNISDSDGNPVENAQITVEALMPAHGHGMQTSPESTMTMDKGAYLVEGMQFSMPGHWVMTFKIKTADKSDSVMFNLNLK